MSATPVVTEKEARILVDQLSVPPSERDNKKLIKIKECLENVKFLKSYSETQEYNEVLRNLELERCELDHVLFKQGDEADKFYIVLTGVIGLFINVQTSSNDNILGQGVREVAKMQPGDAFGELGLLFNETRSATAVCLEQTILLSLNKQVFDQYLSNAKNERLDTMTSFYSNLWIFKELTNKEILKLATKTTLNKCASNTIIIRQGERPKGIFFIHNGIVKILETLRFRIDPVTEEILDEYRDPNPEQIKEKQYKTIDMELEEYGNGNYFCDYYLFNNLDVPFNALTITQCDILTITDFDLKTCLRKDIYNELKEQAKFFPTTEKIKKQFFENLMWKNFKSKVMLHMNHEILNQKRSKDSKKAYLDRIDLNVFNTYDDVQEEIDLKKSKDEVQVFNLLSSQNQKDKKFTPQIKQKVKQRKLAEKLINKQQKEHQMAQRLINNVDEKQKMVDSMKHTKQRNESQKFLLPKINPRSSVFNIVNQIY